MQGSGTVKVPWSAEDRIWEIHGLLLSFFFFFCEGFLILKITSHFTAGRSFSSHQLLKTQNWIFFFIFFFFVEQELSIEVALYLTWKEKLAFTKLQQYLAYSCSKATMWDPSLIFWSNKSTFRQLSVLRQHMAFFFLSCDKNIQMQSLSQYKKKKKKMEIKSVHQIWHNEKYCHAIKIILITPTTKLLLPQF